MINKDEAPRTGGAQGYLRIATEEAFITPGSWRGIQAPAGRQPGFDEPGFQQPVGFLRQPARARARQFINDRLQNLGAQRIADMDATGIDHQVIALTAPGVQVFEPAEGSARWPSRRTTCCTTRARRTRRASPAWSPSRRTIRPTPTKEMERAVRKLGFKAAIVNSHTRGDYLDAPKFLAGVRSRRSAERADLPASAGFASEADDRAVPRIRLRRRGVRLRRGDRPAHAAHHRGRRVRPLPEAASSSSAIPARRCRSGCIAWTTCTARRCARSAIRS